MTAKGTLHMIGLGLGDEKDITLRGLETLRGCTHVFLDTYTSVLSGRTPAELAALYGCAAITAADRDTVESHADQMLAPCEAGEHVAFLVVGDPLGATTHADLYLRARARSIPVDIVHNASIMNAAASSGLQLYLFGATASIPFFTPRWRPHSFLGRVRANAAAGLHTLCLLDIRVHERSDEDIAAGRDVYEPPRFMSVRTALEQVLESADVLSQPADESDEPSEPIVTRDSIAVALMRVGHPRTQSIVAGTVGELLAASDDVFGPPLHSLVIAAPVLHDIEYAMLRERALEGSVIAANRTFSAFKEAITRK